MKLDISDLLNKNDFRKNLHINLDEKSFYDGSEYINVLDSMKFSGILKKIKDIFILDGVVNTVLELTCSRCLDKFSYPINIKKEVIKKREEMLEEHRLLKCPYQEL
jgi:uncharacterized protein